MSDFKTIKVMKLLREVKKNNILIWTEENDIKLKFKKGEIPDQLLLQELKSYRNDILNYLISTEKYKGSKVSLQEANPLPVVPMPQQEHYATMHQQQKEYLRYLITGKNKSHIWFTIYFKHLEKEALEEAINSILERHESLRTTFISINGDMRQVVHPYRKGENVICYMDLSMLDEKEILAVANQELNNISFDFESMPLVNIKVVKIPGDLSVLVFTMHHVISDGGSLEILKREIDTLYEAYVKKEKNPLSPVQFQYKDYSEWINKVISSPEGMKCRDQYKQTILDSLSKEEEDSREFKGMQRSYSRELECEMRTVIKQREPSVYREVYGKIVTLAPGAGASYTFFVEETYAGKLKDLSVLCSVSLFTIMIAAFAGLFYKKNKKNVRISIPFSTRGPGFEQTVGWLTHNLIICVDVEEEMNVEQFVKAVNNIIWDSADFRFYPHERMMADLDLPLNVLAPVYINFIRETDFQIDHFRPYHRDKGSGILDLKCLVNECRNGIIIEMHYNIEKFSRNEIEQIGDRYLYILKKMADNHELQVKSI